MVRKVVAVFIIFLVVVIPRIRAQESNLRLFRFFELFGGIGTSHYFGDIGGSYNSWPGFLDRIDNFRDFDPLETRISLAFGTRYIFNRSFGVSGMVAPVWLSGSDYGSSKEVRGWSFNTFMVEFSGQFEYYWLRPYSGFNPYLFAGMGGTARYTEAQFGAKQTAFYTGNVLFTGMGFRYSNNKLWTHGGEVGVRYALSDYIEMFNGNTGKNDVYYLLQYRLSYQLTRGSIYNGKGLVRQSIWDRMRFNKKKREGELESLMGVEGQKELTEKDRRKIERYLKKKR